MIAAFALAASLAGEAPAHETVAWKPEQALAVDLDGDGRRELLRFGLTTTELVVAVQLSSGAKGELRFERKQIGCNPVDFAPACDMPRPTASTFPIDEESIRSHADVFEVPPTIFVSTGKAQIASFPIGETDPIWFFWNAELGRLDWLRA